MGLQRVGHNWVTELNWTEQLWGDLVVSICISLKVNNWSTFSCWSMKLVIGALPLLTMDVFFERMSIRVLFPLYFFFLIYILLKYSWLTMFQVYSKVIQFYTHIYYMYICIYITHTYMLFFRLFSIICYYKILIYSSLWYTVNLCCLLHI